MSRLAIQMQAVTGSPNEFALEDSDEWRADFSGPAGGCRVRRAGHGSAVSN